MAAAEAVGNLLSNAVQSANHVSAFVDADYAAADLALREHYTALRAALDTREAAMAAKLSDARQVQAQRIARFKAGKLAAVRTVRDATRAARQLMHHCDQAEVRAFSVVATVAASRTIDERWVCADPRFPLLPHCPSSFNARASFMPEQSQ